MVVGGGVDEGESGLGQYVEAEVAAAFGPVVVLIREDSPASRITEPRSEGLAQASGSGRLLG
jgi:hypothetical protein